MAARKGKVTIPPGADVWPHELETARALASAGRDVEFLRRTEGHQVKSADVSIDGATWEMKAPKTSDVRRLERVVRRASQQSPNVVVDTARSPRMGDAAAERELRRIAPLNRRLRRLVLVTKARRVIDIL